MRAKQSLWRFKDIFAIFLRHVCLHVLHLRLARWPSLARRLPGENLPGPKRFRLMIEEIGGTFIKFGQMLAMQTDLLPLEYCAALFSLFDQTEPFDYSEVERTFVEDLKRTPPEIFDSFELEPLATGSIGQVHVAVLRGTKVAVKVIRPTIVSDFQVDIVALKFVVRTVKLLRLRVLYWIIAPTEEFIAWTQEELDFRREAHYMDELGRNARDNEHEKVPAVFWSYTTSRILTIEFLEGLTLSEYLRQRETGIPEVRPDFEPRLFASWLIDNFLGDAFRHGMFHADLHPGNLIILPGNVVGYIDFGISGVLSGYSRRHLIAMTLAYARADLEGMCESFFKITTMERDADLRGFRQGLKDASSSWYGNGSADQSSESRLRKSITSVMLDLLMLSRRYGIWPQRDVIKYIRSAVALDGLVKTFSPGMDIGRHLELACERHIKWDSMRNLISPEAVTGWFEGYTHLLRDGALRAFSLLRRTGTESAPPPVLFDEDSKLKTRRYLLLQLAWIAICALLLWKPAQLTSTRVMVPLLLVLTVNLIWQFIRRSEPPAENERHR
jgi:predicted unusual protein kinase regulating ubiquinone biosynthesis (AarF/ABC1/UbiB family)